ncbi:hypothetical protein [Paraclostridium bifermentans]|uniref:hypothetical protein n=1 Tax=Paraclostridium bifermentans TaxID=1490 RepID=UPI001896D763|nr:hypothetical protein [Paraclostridium bifermentans]
MSYNKDTLKFDGFHLEDKYSLNIPEPNISIDFELWRYLQSITEDFKLKEEFISKDFYTIEDKEIIEIIPFEYEDSKPSRVDLLEKENANLLQESLKKDIEIKDLNINLAQTTLSLVDKDIKIKGLQKDVANLILQTLGGN